MAIKIKNTAFFVKWDSIAMMNNPDGGLLVEFSLKGKKMSYMNIPQASFKDDNTSITIENIKGKQKATTTTI